MTIPAAEHARPCGPVSRTIALELSLAPERRAAYSVMVQRIREALTKGGLVASDTSQQVGYRIEPAHDEPNDRIVVTWHDPGLEGGDAMPQARQRRALEHILWLVADEMEDISGAHLQAWGEPLVVVNYGDFDPDAGE